MKTTFGIQVFVVFALVLSAASQSVAQFGRTEEQIMEADINEARRRAKDFKNHLALVQKRKELQESIGPQEVKKKREEFEKKREASREAYLKERDSRPVAKEEVILRLEAAFDRMREEEEAKMDVNRLRRIEKRDRVRRTIEREGYIDERLEFDM